MAQQVVMTNITSSITLTDLYEQKLVLPEDKVKFKIKEKTYEAWLVCVNNIAQLQIELKGKLITAPRPYAFYKAVVEALNPGSPENKSLARGKSSKSFIVRHLSLDELKKYALANKIMRNPKVHSISPRLGYVVAYTSEKDTQKVAAELSKEFKSLRISVVYEEKRKKVLKNWVPGAEIQAAQSASDLDNKMDVSYGTVGCFIQDAKGTAIQKVDKHDIAYFMVPKETQPSNTVVINNSTGLEIAAQKPKLTDSDCAQSPKSDFSSYSYTEKKYDVELKSDGADNTATNYGNSQNNNNSEFGVLGYK